MGHTRPEPLRGKHDFGNLRRGDHELDDWLHKYSRHAEAARSAHSHEGAGGFYDHYGFEESPTDPLHRILLMKDLRLLLDEMGVSPDVDVDLSTVQG